MARTPRASVSKTSGQGISRLSYQRGRKLAGGTPDIKSPRETSFGSESSSGRSRGKARDYGKQVEGLNVSYGETFHPTDLDDIENSFKDSPKHSNLAVKESKRYKK